MIGIFLDDERTPEDVTWVDYPSNIEWYIVRRSSDFLFAVFNMDNFDDVIFSFDHDIQDFDFNGDEVTGYDCLKSLVDYCLQKEITIPVCVFHSKNPVGVENMAQFYNCAKTFEGERNET